MDGPRTYLCYPKLNSSPSQPVHEPCDDVDTTRAVRGLPLFKQPSNNSLITAVLNKLTRIHFQYTPPTATPSTVSLISGGGGAGAQCESAPPLYTPLSTLSLRDGARNAFRAYITPLKTHAPEVRVRVSFTFNFSPVIIRYLYEFPTVQ